MQSPENSLHRASELERRWLFPLRAAEWRGTLSVDQYIQRNARLYSHSFGQKIETWIWKVNSEVCASVDILPISFLVKTSEGIHTRSGVLLAAGLTAPAKRGHGFLNALIAEYVKTHPDQIAIGFSLIGTDYYSRIGLVASPTPALICEEHLGERRPPDRAVALSLSMEEFHPLLLKHRQRAVELASGTHVAAIAPSLEFLDWHVERYRFFAEIMGKELPDGLFWSVGDETTRGSLEIAALPDYSRRCLDVLWVEQGASLGLDFAHGLARDWGFQKVRYVVRCSIPSLKNPEVPVMRFPGAPDAQYLDPQLCDYW